MSALTFCAKFINYDPLIITRAIKTNRYARPAWPVKHGLPPQHHVTSFPAYSSTTDLTDNMGCQIQSVQHALDQKPCP